MKLLFDHNFSRRLVDGLVNLYPNASHGPLPMPREALQGEYAWVIAPNGIADEEAYLSAVRSGRPQITRQQRRQVWADFRMFQHGLHKRNLLTFDGASIRRA